MRRTLFAIPIAAASMLTAAAPASASTPEISVPAIQEHAGPYYERTTWTYVDTYDSLHDCTLAGLLGVVPEGRWNQWRCWPTAGYHNHYDLYVEY